MLKPLLSWIFGPHIFEIVAFFLAATGVALSLSPSKANIQASHWFFGASFLMLLGRTVHWLVTSNDIPLPKPVVAAALFALIGGAWMVVYQWVEKQILELSPATIAAISKSSERTETALYLDCAYEGFPITIPAGSTIHVVRVAPQTIKVANHAGAFPFLDVRANRKDRIWPHDNEAEPLLLRTYQGLPINTGHSLRCTVRKYGQGTVAKAIIRIQVGDFFDLLIAPLESSGNFESFTFYLINACYPDVKPGAHLEPLNPFVGGFPDKAKLQILGESDWKEVPLSVAYNANSMSKTIFLQPVYRRWKDIPPCY